ncbi:DNA methyltransferase [Xanthobacter autotrophicus]|uniref:DNA methyltransferase n=1 Tax=Xanthobacter autotrophicus TaxID=280 RepID=UPI00372D6CDD
MLARKPLAGTVAETVLAHGTGALNIDGCRVEGEPWASSGESVGGASLHAYGDGLNNAGRSGAHGLGRWPANVVHDGSPEVVAAFPHSDGGGDIHRRSSPKTSGILGAFSGNDDRWSGYADTGSAARFFYSAKADADDRLGSKHPTIKPVDLMQWLCRLVCPPGGVILDPFAGTGTTGEAAWREGFCAVLIEREAAYQADIRRRMALCLAGPAERKRESAKARGLQGASLPLFGDAGEAAE